ncbi:PilN domain-containing protein [Candidatus Saccharibacteria bacterium]|nr:PilN domain-containing protein [Candidatus Saccharibacteria bacterium]
MIQFNLLPDVKMKYIVARRQKHRVMTIAMGCGLAAVGLLVLMMVYVYVVQGAQIATYNKRISNSQSSITTKNSQVDDINKVLTVQNQLISLDSLHNDKPIMSRIFDYLAKITPSNITISKIDLAGGETNVITLQGSTDTLASVNKFVDTLKFTTFKTEDSGSGGKQVFTDVVLASFARDKAGASYGLSFSFDPIIFSSATKVDDLIVPDNKVTTRSELGRPIIQSDSEQQNNAPDQTGVGN